MRPARWLRQAKERAGRPFDPVARFYRANGAQVQAEAGVLPKGRAQSFVVMANYLYDLPRVSQNHESYATRREAAASAEVAALAKAAPLAQNSER